MRDIDKCPCGNAKPRNECCYAPVPPLERDTPVRISSVGPATFKFMSPDYLPYPPEALAQIQRALPDITLDANRLFRQIDEVCFQAVSSTMNSIETRLASGQPKDAVLTARYATILALWRSLQTTHYHLQNFIYRSHRQEQSERLRPPMIRAGDKLSVSLSDLPMAAELDAFLVGCRISSEVLFKVIGDHIGLTEKKRTWPNVIETLESASKGSKSKKRGWQRKLLDHLHRHETWFTTMRTLRSEVVHDGSTNVLVPFRHTRHGSQSARIHSMTADDACFSHWRHLVDMVRVSLEILSKGAYAA